MQAGMLWKTQGNWKCQLVSNLAVISFRKFFLNFTAWMRPHLHSILGSRSLLCYPLSWYFNSFSRTK